MSKWKVPETPEEWEQHHWEAVAHMGGHDNLPRGVRLFIYEHGDLPARTLAEVVSALNAGHTVKVMARNGRRYVIKHGSMSHG